jgi:hypothetical protein
MEEEPIEELYLALLGADQQLLHIKDAEEKFSEYLVQVRRWMKLASAEKVKEYRRNFPDIFKYLEEHVRVCC